MLLCLSFPTFPRMLHPKLQRMCETLLESVNKSMSQLENYFSDVSLVINQLNYMNFNHSPQFLWL